MERFPNTARLNHILLALLCIGFFSGLIGLSPPYARAQHEIDSETWIEMRKMLRHKGPAPTIEENIAALAGPDAKRAGPRLIDQGPAALAAVHSALGSAEFNPLQAQRLLQVLRSIGDKTSVPVVLEILKNKSLLRRDSLLVLAYLPATEKAAAYMVNLAAKTNEPWPTYRMSFTWFGLHRDPRGRPFAEQLRTDPDPEKRSAALFVLARLGDKSVLEPVSELLASGPPPNSRDILMYSLAEITTPGEFEKRAPSSLTWSRGYKDALLYARYRAAGPQEKISLSLQMLRSQMPGLRETGVNYLLENGHAKDLRPYAAVSLEVPGLDAVIRNDIRKAGWRIIDTDTEFSIVPADSAKARPRF
ncbi:MAG: HEAT repeat domain-containing protein [Desulfobulbales bacterium]|nr:HEAT repeat domain-containing protein [Desulfobulbales bacterium]